MIETRKYRTHKKKFGCKILTQSYTARACIDVDMNIFFSKQDRFHYRNKNTGMYFSFFFYTKRSDSMLEQTFCLL